MLSSIPPASPSGRIEEDASLGVSPPDRGDSAPDAHRPSPGPRISPNHAALPEAPPENLPEAPSEAPSEALPEAPPEAPSEVLPEAPSEVPPEAPSEEKALHDMPSMPDMPVSGAPDQTQLFDLEWHQRLDTISEPLGQKLGLADGAAPTPTGRLTGADLAGLLYQLQIFQEHALGKSATRPANPDVPTSSPYPDAERHPTRIPAWCFRLPSPASPEHKRALLSILLTVLQEFARAIPSTGEDVLEPIRRPFYTSVIAKARAQLKEEGILPTISVYAPVQWPESQRTHAKQWADSLECT